MPKIKLTHRGIETLKAGKWLTGIEVLAMRWEHLNGDW